MTKSLKNLLKAKELIEKKLDLNNSLLETIKVLRQDENNLKEIKKRLKEEYRR